jgi:hypothetical protein
MPEIPVIYLLFMGQAWPRIPCKPRSNKDVVRLLFLPPQDEQVHLPYIAFLRSLLYRLRDLLAWRTLLLATGIYLPGGWPRTIIAVVVSWSQEQEYTVGDHSRDPWVAVYYICTSCWKKVRCLIWCIW